MRLYICCVLLGLYGSLRANDIDRLRTKEDLQKFLVNKVDEYYSHIPAFDGRAGTPGTALSDSFFRVDLDNNGLTDLEQDRSQTDTLVYMAQAFLEYNPAPDAGFQFHGIRLHAGGCYGTCPIFELSATASGTASLNAISYNKKNGKFTGTIPAEEMTTLVGILQYIRWDRLDSSYAVNWTDDRTLTLEIDYNGIHRRIADYGGRGTFGLSRVYGIISHWRETAKWQP